MRVFLSFDPKDTAFAEALGGLSWVTTLAREEMHLAGIQTACPRSMFCKDMVRDAKYFRLACRVIAELGAQYVKTYYVEEDFETVTASCPVPIVMAGGKKLPELEALAMAYKAVQQRTAGVDMGRNIFQSDAQQAIISAVHAVVHKNLKPADAFATFKALKAEG